MFADLFHHRALLLFYRAWAVTQPTVSQDREESSRFAAYVGSTFGIGQPALSGKDGLPDRAKLQYAGWFSCPTRPAEGVRRMPVREASITGALLMCHVDGEPFRASGRLEVRVEPGALRVAGLARAPL